MWWTFGWAAGIFFGMLVLVPGYAEVPRCTEDEIVVVSEYLWVEVPDKCVNIEDAEFFNGHWYEKGDYSE